MTSLALRRVVIRAVIRATVIPASVCALAVGAAGCGQPRSQPAGRPSTTTSSAIAKGATTAGVFVLESVPPGLPDPAGPTRVTDGAPMGYRPDAAGAKAAAVNFARLNEALVQMSESAATAAWRAMASTSSAKALVEDFSARLGLLRSRWPAGSLTYRVAPLAVRVSEATPADMRVDVWYVGVVAGASLPTYEEWITETYRLVWERDDWRVAEFSDAPGPRPSPGNQAPASPAEIDARLADFEAIR